MRVLVLRVGRGRARWADEACADWIGRLPSQLRLEEDRLAPERFRGEEEEVRRAESARVLDHLRTGDRLIALDERGEEADNRELAAWFERASREGIRRLVFAIGGPYGHAGAVRERAWRTLALSRLVLAHEVARVVLVEQIYRSSTILWGGPYHHGER